MLSINLYSHYHSLSKSVGMGAEIFRKSSSRRKIVFQSPRSRGWFFPSIDPKIRIGRTLIDNANVVVERLV